MLKKMRQRPIFHGLFVSLILLVPAFLLYCGQDTDLENPSNLRMVNGSRPGPDHPASYSAVALVDNNSQNHFCSGTLVAEHLIVTASHCVFDKRPEDFQILFGSDVKEQTAVRRDPEALATFKKFQKFESNFDIAWVRFQGDIPAGFRPIEIWHGPERLEPNSAITIAGYGRTASQCDFTDPTCNGGKLLFVDTSVREFVNHGRLFNLIVIGPRPDHGPCFGDSGGPAYIQHDGRWYLVGDFMGWDRILVSEQLETICDTGEAIYNFVGDFADWIEETSQIKLPYDAPVNPRKQPSPMPMMTEEPKDFQGWCQYSNHEDPAWFTVQRLIRQVSDFRIAGGDAPGGREVFEDCEAAEKWLRKMLAENHKLEIGGFDPSTFIDSARLEDVRPLRVLKDMGIEELKLLDHAITDLSPLTALTGLKHLTIVDNALPTRQLRSEVQPLRIAAFPQLQTLRLQNLGVPVDLSHLDQLKNLNKLHLGYMNVPALSGLENLPLQELRLDSMTLAEPVDLAPLAKLQSLFLNLVALKNMPPQWNNLESLDLLEVRGLNMLPVEAPRLKRLFVYSTDLGGEVTIGNWPALEEASIYANATVTSAKVPFALPKLLVLEISENSQMTEVTLAAQPALNNLLLARNGLKVLPNLTELNQLTRLNLEGNHLTTISALRGLPKLQYVELSENPLANLEGLADLPALKRVVIQNNKGEGLKTLQGMINLPKLKELNFARNSLTGIQELLAFKSIEVLILNDNLLEDIAALKDLPSLEYLEVVNNPLKEKVCPIKDEPKACRFEWLNFSQNGPIVFPGSPLADQAGKQASIKSARINVKK